MSPKAIHQGQQFNQVDISLRPLLSLPVITSLYVNLRLLIPVN